MRIRCLISLLALTTFGGDARAQVFTDSASTFRSDVVAFRSVATLFRSTRVLFRAPPN